jgi:hypothetical protein
MKSCTIIGPSIVLLLLGSLVGRATAQQAKPLQKGVAINLGGRTALLTKLDALPWVASAYSKRFHFDAWTNPKLKDLRERYHLDKVVAPGKDEFDRQVLLLDCVHQRFHKFGRPTSDARGALAILKANDAGHTFFCAHYADVLVSAAASLGWVDRRLCLRRPDNQGEGATEHSVTEIWSNQYRKWVMFDPTFALYVEKDNVPLNAYELRQEWFYHAGRDLVFVIGKERKQYRKADLPIFRKRFAGFGDLSLTPTALHMHAFIGYIPNTNLMDARPDYAQMFIVQDKVCAGTKWHKRPVPAHPAQDPYFPTGQAALTLRPKGSDLQVGLKTLTPNFKTYLVRIEGGKWQPAEDGFTWKLQAGDNRLEAKTVNQFAVEGPVSTAVVDIQTEVKNK